MRRLFAPVARKDGRKNNSGVEGVQKKPNPAAAAAAKQQTVKC